MKKKCVLIFFLLILSGCNANSSYENTTNSFGQNDLMRAIYYQDLQKVKELVNEGNQLNEVDIHGATVLHYVAVYGTSDIASFLVKQPVEKLHVEKGGIRNNLPIQEAVLSGNKDVIDVFLEYSSEYVKEVRDDMGRSILHYAVIQMDADLVSYLLKLGMNPNLKDINGNTPGHLLLYAVETDYVEELNIDFNPNGKERILDGIARDLIVYGMDLDTINKKGETFRIIVKAIPPYVFARNNENYSLLDNSSIILNEILYDYDEGNIKKDEI